MPNFSVEFSPAALRDLHRLDPPVRLHLLHVTAVLRDTPYPTSGSRIKLLVGVTPRHFRLRVGDYWIVYRIEENRVLVVRVAHRREAYR